MKDRDILNALEMTNDEYIEEAAPKNYGKIKKLPWVKFVSVAACVAVILGIGIPVLVTNRSDNRIMLNGEKSYGVKVEYNDNLSGISSFSDYSLAWLLPEEIIEDYSSAVFRGTVTEIKNIVFNFNGMKEYFAVAKIRISKVLKGSCKENQTVSILLPCPIDAGVWVEDTDTVSAMRVGMEGIFMPTAYDENSVREENDGKLYLSEVAEYGFNDGDRYAFLATDSGLVFCKDTFSDIADAINLDEVETYLEGIISQ